jgi:hypothetical protein
VDATRRESFRTFAPLTELCLVIVARQVDGRRWLHLFLGDVVFVVVLDRIIISRLRSDLRVCFGSVRLPLAVRERENNSLLLEMAATTSQLPTAPSPFWLPLLTYRERDQREHLEIKKLDRRES